mgnify:CR=1 FL=1
MNTLQEGMDVSKLKSLFMERKRVRERDRDIYRERDRDIARQTYKERKKVQYVT